MATSTADMNMKNNIKGFKKNATFKSYKRVKKAVELFEIEHKCKLSTRDSSKMKLEQLNSENKKLIYNYILFKCEKNGSKRKRNLPQKSTVDEFDVNAIILKEDMNEEVAVKKKITRARESKKIGCPVKIKLERKQDEENQREVLKVTKFVVKHSHALHDLSEDELLADKEESQRASNSKADSKLFALRKELQKIETFARDKTEDEVNKIEEAVAKLHDHLLKDLNVSFMDDFMPFNSTENFLAEAKFQHLAESKTEDFFALQAAKTTGRKRGRGRTPGTKNNFKCKQEEIP